MASITANVTFVRWSVKWKLSCLVRGRLRDYKNQSTSAPSRSLKKYFKKFSNRQEWVLGRREGGFTRTPFHITSLNTKQTNWSRVWCDIASNWSKLLNKDQLYWHVFFYNVLLKFYFWTALKQFLGQTRRKLQIERLSPKEKLSNEQFSIKFTVFSNNTTYNSSSIYTAS